jgi:hypothetical protein
VASGGVTTAVVVDAFPTEVRLGRTNNLARTAVAPLGQSDDLVLRAEPLLTCAEPSSMSVIRPYRRFADALRPPSSCSSAPTERTHAPCELRSIPRDFGVAPCAART